MDEKEAAYEYMLREIVHNKNNAHLLTLRIFPNTKEVSESMAAYRGILENVQLETRADSNVRCYVVGDGTTPRTASMFAVNTAWTVYCIDPLVKKRRAYTSIKRLILCPQKCEDFAEIEEASLSIVVGVHSHANWNDFWVRVPLPKLGLAIPCCMPQQVADSEPFKTYQDTLIQSPCNTVHLWKEYGDEPTPQVCTQFISD